MSDIHSERILILDFGSQYTQLIARRVREARVYCEIFPFNAGLDKIRAFRPKGLILSGGPSSVYDSGAPLIDKAHLELGVPVLGICYGMQLLTHVLGGQVAKSTKREYGRAELIIDNAAGLFNGYWFETPNSELRTPNCRLDEPRRPDRENAGGILSHCAHGQFTDRCHGG